jgi:hypothetical protein
MSTSAWIDVERKEGWRDRARPYKVVIDGQKVGGIGHGQLESFEVVPGTHEVFLKTGAAAPSSPSTSRAASGAR